MQEKIITIYRVLAPPVHLAQMGRCLLIQVTMKVWRKGTGYLSGVDVCLACRCMVIEGRYRRD